MKFKCPNCGFDECYATNNKVQCAFCNKTYTKEELLKKEKEKEETVNDYYNLIDNIYKSKDEEYNKNSSKADEIIDIKIKEESKKEGNNNEKPSFKKVMSTNKEYIKSKFKDFKTFLKEQIF